MEKAGFIDSRRYNIDAYCLQQTRIKEGFGINLWLRQHRLIALVTVNIMEVDLPSVSNGRITPTYIAATNIVYILNNDIKRAIYKIPSLSSKIFEEL